MPRLSVPSFGTQRLITSSRTDHATLDWPYYRYTLPHAGKCGYAHRRGLSALGTVVVCVSSNRLNNATEVKSVAPFHQD